MVELVEWDRARMILGSASDAHGEVWDSEKTDVFVNDGAFLFRSILATLHGAPGAFDKRNDSGGPHTSGHIWDTFRDPRFCKPVVCSRFLEAPAGVEPA